MFVSSNPTLTGDTTLCNKVCQWLTTGWWFSLGTLSSFLHQKNSPQIYNWNIVDSGIKHHKPNHIIHSYQKYNNLSVHMGLVLVYIQVIICSGGRGCFLCLRMWTVFRTYSLVGWLKNVVIGKLCVILILILTTYSYCDCVFMIIMLWMHANMRVYTCLNRTHLLVLKSYELCDLLQTYVSYLRAISMTADVPIYLSGLLIQSVNVCKIQ